MNDITETLKGIRKARGLTQKQFADRLNMKQSGYSMIENGSNKPSFDLLRSISEEFEVDPALFFAGHDINTIYNILISNGVNHSVNSDVNHKGQNRVKSSDLSQKNTEQIRARVQMIDKVYDEALKTAFSIDQLSVKTKRLNDLQYSYYHKVNRELENNNNQLYNLMRLAERTDALADTIWTATTRYINARPNPFDAYEYIDLQNKTETIPDNIDYKQYKQDVIAWLQGLVEYKRVIEDFYNEGEAFLGRIKPLDTDGIIE